MQRSWVLSLDAPLAVSRKTYSAPAALEDVACSIHQIGAQLPRVVILDKAPQASMFDGANIHSA